MDSKQKKQEALLYHERFPSGKLGICATKRLSSQLDLALAYSPGVAEPCKEIASHSDHAYKYTAKGNLVAVISNGTSVLGLGNIGAVASKPVMEGKAVLFKKFAGIDVFDLEIDATDIDRFVDIVQALSPTFGGINLEDIKAPESFEIERRLCASLDIPVMHDDQHGTAIISSAALLNAVEVTGKDLSSLRVVVNGAGAAAMACIHLYLSLGISRERLVVLDSKGVIRKDREGLSDLKAAVATDKDLHTLSEAIVDADMFLGLSRGNVLTSKMLLSMSKDPIVFALANPDPEIAYSEAMATRSDVVMATGRSDHPNQVNNVLGFPYIFRGALDVRARAINEEMKLAAVHAIASLAKESVPEGVKEAYGGVSLRFGRDYLIPKPLDLRLITKISPAVARAAISTGVSRVNITDWEGYEKELQQRIGIGGGLISEIVSRARFKPDSVSGQGMGKIVFGNAEELSVLRAARMIYEAKIARPILLGDLPKIEAMMQLHDIDLEGVEVMDPRLEESRIERYASLLYKKRQRKGMTFFQAKHAVSELRYFGSFLVETGEAHSALIGLREDYAMGLRSALEVVGCAPNVTHIAGMYVLSGSSGNFFLADTSVNIDPSVAVLSKIIFLCHDFVERLYRKPRMALLSYSNFGSSYGDVPKKMRETLKVVSARHPDWCIDGDIQADVAVSRRKLADLYSFSALREKGANTLIFPHLAASNIAYKLLMELGNFEAIGPILLGMGKPVYVLQQGADAHEIFHLASMSMLVAQQQRRTPA